MTGRAGLFAILADCRPGEAPAVRVRRGADAVELRPRLAAWRRLGRAPVDGERGAAAGDPVPRVVVQHDTWLLPGECGGPIVDLDGRAAGVTFACVGRVATYALPAESARPLVRALMAGAYPPDAEDLDRLASR